MSLSDLRNPRVALSLATTANQLTILRIVFVPLFIILLVYNEAGWAFGTFVIAGITDVLDGIIARRFGQKTSIGAVLDPLADKLLMTSSIVILSLPQMEFLNTVPRWLMIVIIFRDVFILLVTCGMPVISQASFRLRIVRIVRWLRRLGIAVLVLLPRLPHLPAPGARATAGERTC